MQEIFKDVKGYEGMYEVSNLGRVKSLKRKYQPYTRILKAGLSSSGYLTVSFSINSKPITYSVHVLVAIAFLKHKTNSTKIVVDHIDYVKTNNKLDNLRIITQRENSSKSHLPSSSKYVGVYYYKTYNKWASRILINGKIKHIGYFKDELQASKSYKKEISLLK